MADRMLAPASRTAGIRSQAGMQVYLPSRDLPVNKDSLPDLQVQQPPDPIAVVTMSSTVVGKQSPDRVFFEQSTLQRAALHQHTLQVIQLRPRQPVSPRSGEPHLLPIRNRVGKNIFDGGLQNRFSGQAFDGIFRW